MSDAASDHTVDIEDEENEAPTEAEDDGNSDGEKENDENEDKEKKKKFPKLKKPKGMKKPKFGFKGPPKAPKAPAPPKTPQRSIQPGVRKRRMVQGMIDVALLSSNIGHLRDILDAGDSHKYFEVSTYMISGSILLQMLIGVGITMLPPYKFFDNLLSLMIYVVLFLNLFITAFALIKK